MICLLLVGDCARFRSGRCRGAVQGDSHGCPEAGSRKDGQSGRGIAVESTVAVRDAGHAE